MSYFLPNTGDSVIHLNVVLIPDNPGINPLPMDWGHKDPQKRGPVIVSRNSTTIRRRNGMYSNHLFGLHSLLFVQQLEVKTTLRCDIPAF